MSVPAKYLKLGDFPDYYAGRRKAPYLTIFAAGNHEASSYLGELHYGGWVAPNIYYMGAANVLRLGPIRIMGMGGIWKGVDFRKPHFERLPYNDSDKKSFYHVREIDVRKLLQIRTQVDVGISHDWPRAVEKHGRREILFRMKPAFERESNDGTLGNPAAANVMDRLRPRYWFSAHMHCKFTAIKDYSSEPAVQAEQSNTRQESAPQEPAPAPAAANPDEIDLGFEDEPTDAAAPALAPAPAAPNPDEIDLDLDEDGPAPQQAPTTTTTTTTTTDTDALRSQLPAAFSKPAPKSKYTQPGQPVPATITNTVTRFLALDKCLPGRHFLQLATIPSPLPDAVARPLCLEYDPEFLSILRAFHPSLIFGDRTAQVPADLGEEGYRPLIEKEREWVEDNIVKKGLLKVPEKFEITAPPQEEGKELDTRKMVQPKEYTNPQTAEFCKLLEIENYWDADEAERKERMAKGPDREGNHRGGGRGGGGGRGRGGRDRGRGGRGGGRGGGGGGGWRGGERGRGGRGGY